MQDALLFLMQQIVLLCDLVCYFGMLLLDYDSMVANLPFVIQYPCVDKPVATCLYAASWVLRSCPTCNTGLLLVF
jgi:hypothetical protein